MDERHASLISLEQKVIGILWIFFIALVYSCSDSNKTVSNCNIIPVDGLNCTYFKGEPQEPPINDIKVPSAPKNLQFEVGYASVGGKCESRVNVTWTVSYDDSLDRLRGFYLIIMITRDNGHVVNDTVMFNVNSSNWLTAYQTQFRYDCMRAERTSWYHIQLFSLPMNVQQHNMIIHPSPRTGTFSEDDQCERTGDPNYTSNWIATMWVTENPSDASIVVCFRTAPPSFNFKRYAVSLLPNPIDRLNIVTEKKIRTVDRVKDIKVCETFRNVCSGVYKVWVMPINDPYGTCRIRDALNRPCTATVIQDINMTSSICSGTHVTARISTSVRPEANPTSLNTTGIVIGVVAAIVVVSAVVAIGIYVYRYRPLARRLYNIRLINSRQGSPSYPIDDQQIVLLVYSSDNECHRKVVRNFAAFLHSCCKCDVRFDDWSQVDISQTNALDWLTKQLHQVKHIIFINSLGAFMQHKAWIEGSICQPVKELLLPDMFIPALRQVQARVYDKQTTTKQRLQIYHVYFPYTEAKHLLDVSFGQHYKQMKHIEDLFLNIHGMTKYSGTGLTSACQINVHGYTDFDEGQALQSAIEEACASYNRNPNWFQEYFNYTGPGESMEREVTLLHNGPSDGDVHCSSDIQPVTSDASIDSEDLKATTKCSDEGVDFGSEIVPPSSSGSWIMDHRLIIDRRIVSKDVGIGDTTESSSTCDNNLSSIQLKFRPPVNDDDDDEEEGHLSTGSRFLFERMNSLNEQFDKGNPFSSL